MQSLELLELRRIQINKKLKNALFILTPTALIVGFLVIYLTHDVSFGIIAGLWILIFFYIVFRDRVTKDFESDFKDQVIAALIYQIQPNLVYKKREFIPYNEFNFANLYPAHHEVYRGNDLIRGAVDGVEIKFSDICMQRETGRDNNVQMENIFYGVFFEADFNKSFVSFTTIIDNKSRYARSNLARAHMDDAGFEKLFNVYTQDQIQARYLLSPAFMEKFTKMRELFNCPVNAAFYDNRVYLYIERGIDSFEVNLKKPLSGSDSAIQWYKNEIESFIDLVKMLNLNSKIFRINQLDIKSL